MHGYGAKRVEDDEDYGHHAGVGIALAIEDLVGIHSSLLEEDVRRGFIARLKVLGAKNERGCWSLN